MFVDGASSPPFFRSPPVNGVSGMAMTLDTTNDEDFDLLSSTPNRFRGMSPSTSYSSPFSAKKHNVSMAASVNVHFADWFDDLLQRRKNFSALMIASVVFVSLFVISTLLQLSFIHPIASVYNIFSTYFSWKVWLLFLACGASTFLSFQYGFLNLCSANQLQSLSVWAKSNWTSALVFTLFFQMNSIAMIAARIYRNVFLPWLIIGLPIFGYPILWSVVDLRLHAIALLTLTFTIFTINAALIFTRCFVMQPISFSLPPPYAIVAPSGPQLRTLTNALECLDPLLKLFAGYDLRRIGASDMTRRAEIYALSQPGGHPRNWTSISNSCFAVIQRIQKEIEIAASEYLLPSEVNEESPDRKIMLMPASIRNQMYTSAVRQRANRALLRPHKKKFYLKFFGWIVPEKTIISRYDANMVVYIVDGISWLIVKSIQEDDYGVVQRDIGRITSLLLLTLQTIDKYFRVRNVRPVANGPDAPLLLIDRALRTAIKNIADTFFNHLGDFQFTQEELLLIERLK
ncbi:unnamed protein product, partial [Mesorhabditis belari]|uniref:Nucleoporin NDC1 n=1 Tax=Mesorhabditis belari TaxID=2138241 RepID=A0AAF3FQQ3_9BILA